MNSGNEQTDLREYLSKYIPAEMRDAAGVPILLLTCMDSRYPQLILDTMDYLGWRGKYDQLILAGASLGVVHKQEWQETFLDQLGFAIEHHHVSEVFILDHRDCGAYKYFLGVTPDDPAQEKEAHLKVCKAAVQIIVEKFPQLEGEVRCSLLPIETIDQLITG
jgi:carbonic anhydrase